VRLRGINPLERHAEKLFLALIGLVLLGVIALQFVGSGSTVSVGGQSGIPVERAYQDVADEAERKLAQLNLDQVDERVPQRIEDVASRFAARLEEGVAPREELATWLGRPRVGNVGAGGGPVESLVVALPDLPRPDQPLAAAFAGTLNPLVVDDDLRTAASYLTDRQPYDMRWTTVEAMYNTGALVEALRSDPPGDAAPIPEYWWRQSLEILAVELERRTILPSGETGTIEQVAPWTVGPRLLGDAQSAPDRAALQNIIIRAQERRRDIVRPPFFDLIAGERWAPPSAAAETGAQEAQIRRLLRERREALAEIERLEQRAMSEALRDVFAQVGRPGGPGGRPRDSGNQSGDRDQRREEALEQRRAELQARVEEIEVSLEELGVDPEGRPLRDSTQDYLSAPVQRPVDGGTMRLWAHDLGVRPGATYEYRVRVHIPNPLYGNGPNLAEDVQDLASEPTMASPWSEWSSPVRVESDAYLFIASAVRGGALGGEATREIVTAELYSFFYGYWRRHVARLSPGDAVTGRLDLSELSLPEFEVEEREEGARYVAGRSTMDGTRSLGAEGWYLLDIAPSAIASAGEDPEELVILQDPGGDLVIRREREDRRSDLRARLERNAELGRTAVVEDPSGAAVEADRAGREGREERREERGPGRSPFGGP